MNSPIGPPQHDRRCEGAAGDACRCRCRGTLHRSNLLRLALETKTGTTVSGQDYDEKLTAVFGSAFTDPKAAPTGGQVVRAARGAWDPRPPSWTAGRGATQVEQRIVDVTLRDVLAEVQALNATTKSGWLDFVDDLSLWAGGWEHLADWLDMLLGGTDSRSGYLWSATLAAAMATGVVKPSDSRITTEVRHVPVGHSHPVLSRIQTPRARSGRNLQVISEVADTRILSHPSAAGAVEIGRVFGGSGLPWATQRFLCRLVGAAVSTDLWRHPGAVKHHLLPVVADLRAVHGAQFSLDTHSRTVESLIDGRLGRRWRDAGVW